MEDELLPNEVNVVQLGNSRWIAWDDATTYIGHGETGMAAIGDLISHNFEYYNFKFKFPSLQPERYGNFD